MRAVKSVSIDSERRVIITFLDGSTETLYPNLIWCDAEALKEIIKDLLEEKADAVVQTINNVAVATFTDGADEALIRKLLVSIDPIQEGEGDPSPENIRPISGRSGLSVVRSGKNLIDFASVYDNIQTITFSDGVWTGPGNAFWNARIQIPKAFIGKTLVFSTELTTQGGDARVAATIDGVTKNGTPVANTDVVKSVLVITPVSENDTIWINYSSSGITTVKNPQLEFGSEATDYEPYKGSTYSVNWETEAGTVYGATLDVVSGKLIVDRGYSKLSDLTSWGTDSNLNNGTMRAVISNVLKPVSSVVTTAIMDCRKAVAYGPLQPTWTTSFAISYEGKVVVPMNRQITVAEFLSEYGNHEVCYPLATPIEIQLTPQEVRTLLGENNIWSDSGNILELEYVADTKLYIGESQSGTLGSGRQSISNTELQPVSEKTVEDLTEEVKAETAEKETQEETADERGE